MRNSILLTLTLAACTHTPHHPASAGRQPASEITARSVAAWDRWEVLASDLDRCERKPLEQKLSDEQLRIAVERLKRVSLKFEAILSKIRAVSPQRAATLDAKLKRVALVVDGSDSVDCGAVASPGVVNGEYRPIIFVSLLGASETSWNTVLPHEFAHLVLKAFRWDGGPLREAWPDLLSLSANDYRPYFAEGDGQKTQQILARNSRDPNLSPIMKESYGYACVSALAQRDFSQRRPYFNAYRGMEVHNTSCDFVSAFLHDTKTAAERDDFLYGFLFAGAPRPNLASADFAEVLNELLRHDRLPKPTRLQPERGDHVSLEVDQDGVKVALSLSKNTRDRVLHNIARPLALQLEDRRDIAVAETQNLDLYEPAPTGKPVTTCAGSTTIDCWCFSGNPTSLRLFFLGKDQREVFTVTLNEKLLVPRGCYQF